MRSTWIGLAALGCALAASAAYWQSQRSMSPAAAGAHAGAAQDRSAPSRAVAADGIAVRNAAAQAASAYALAPAVHYRIGGSFEVRAQSVAVGDLNGDGRDDMVVGLNVMNEVATAEPVPKLLIYLQQADGTLAAPIRYGNPWDSKASSDQGLALADMNDDGLLDIVYSNGRGVDIALSDGNGGFTALRGASDVRHKYSLGVLDIDRDGRLDVFAQATLGAASLYFGGRDGPLSVLRGMTTQAAMESVLRVGDVTGDGLPDVALISRYTLGEFWVYPGLREGGLGPMRAYRLPPRTQSPRSLAIGDFDNDGRNEVVLTTDPQDQPERLYVYRQNAAGELGAPTPLVSAYDPAALLAVDLDRDGKTDLAVMHESRGPGLAFYLQGNAGLLPEQRAPFDGSMGYQWASTSLAAGDLNGDGCTDLAVLGPGSAAVYIGSGCKPPRPAPVAQDLDGDRKSDLIWLYPSGYLATWTLDGGRHVGGRSYPFGPGWRVLASGDFDGDGLSDLVWSDGRLMQLWRNDGRGGYLGVPMRDYPPGYRVVASADIDGDGKADLVWQDDDDRVLAAWLMDGATVLRGSSNALTSQCQAVLGSGDLDGDRRSDLLVGDGNELSVYFGQRDGSLLKSSLGPGSYPRGWVLVGVGDNDGDGRSDLFWRYPSAGHLVQWRMNGKRRTIGYSYTVGADWRVLNVADHTGDGRADLIWTNGTHMQLWEAQPTGAGFNGVAMPAYPTGWSLLAPDGAARRRCTF